MFAKYEFNQYLTNILVLPNLNLIKVEPKYEFSQYLTILVLPSLSLTNV
jgi:hypothetical protein